MKRLQIIEALAVVALMAALTVGAMSRTLTLGQEYMTISVNGKFLGAVPKDADVDGLIIKAKRNVMQSTEGYAYVDANITTKLSNQKMQKLMAKDDMLQLLTDAIAGTVLAEKEQAYTISAGSYSANFESKEVALGFLEQVKNNTKGGTSFEIALEASAGTEDVKKAEIINPREKILKEMDEQNSPKPVSAGVVAAVFDGFKSAREESAVDYQNQTGILAMGFADNVYGYENFVDASTLANPQEETREVTKEKETNTIYVVEAGDCLSIIAEKFETTVESIVGLNALENEDAMIYMDQELTVAVPRPDISLRVSQGIVYEENYDAEPTIIPNDAWYSTKEVVHEEGTQGYREVNASVTYENGLEVERKTLHTEVLAESIPAVIEQGTKIPPTYIKPISGGRFTSGYGRRWGRVHKGVDWAVPIGTNVYASSAGTISVAGAVRGYGYAVYINHPDGRQTRYGHLSKVLVTPGQWVEQGQIIALSGNTGRSTGPHVHFEILIDGSQINPLNYMN